MSTPLRLASAMISASAASAGSGSPANQRASVSTWRSLLSSAASSAQRPAAASIGSFVAQHEVTHRGAEGDHDLPVVAQRSGGHPLEGGDHPGVVAAQLGDDRSPDGGGTGRLGMTGIVQLDRPCDERRRLAGAALVAQDVDELDPGCDLAGDVVPSPERGDGAFQYVGGRVGERRVDVDRPALAATSPSASSQRSAGSNESHDSATSGSTSA